MLRLPANGLRALQGPQRQLPAYAPALLSWAALQSWSSPCWPALHLSLRGIACSRMHETQPLGVQCGQADTSDIIVQMRVQYADGSKGQEDKQWLCVELPLSPW